MCTCCRGKGLLGGEQQEPRGLTRALESGGTVLTASFPLTGQCVMTKSRFEEKSTPSLEGRNHLVPSDSDARFTKTGHGGS